MDPLTHTLTGAALADTGLARRTPLATATLVLAANMPDVDAVAYLASTDASLDLRRGWTHGVLAMVLMPILLAATLVLLDRWWRRRSPSPTGAEPPAASFANLLPLAYLGLASHPLLDWFNTYGIRLLMPFDGSWFYGDTLFIIDPWLWLVLGGAVFLCHSDSRRSLLSWGALAALTTAIVVAGSAGRPGARIVWLIGLSILITLRAARGPIARLRPAKHGRLAPRKPEPSAPLSGPVPPGYESVARRNRLIAAAALAAAGLYVALLYVGSVAARRDVETQLAAAGVNVEDMMIGPVPLRPLLHAVVVDTGSRYRVGSYDWLSEPRLLLDRRPIDKPPWTEVVAAAFRAPCLQGMVNWVRFPWVEIETTADGGHVVHLMDARYTRSRTSGFGSGSVRLHPDLSDACETRND